MRKLFSKVRAVPLCTYLLIMVVVCLIKIAFFGIEIYTEGSIYVDNMVDNVSVDGRVSVDIDRTVDVDILR